MNNIKYINSFLILLIFLFLSWFITGFFTIEADQKGLITRFGKFNRESSPGLNYNFPFPIEKVEKISVTRINKDIIGKVNLSNRKNIIKLESDLSYTKESQMLTQDENIIDMHFYVQWKITDPINYVFNIKHGKDNDTVRNIAESIMRQIIGMVNISEALSERRSIIEKILKKGLQEVLYSYKTGIEIVSVGILYSYVAPEVRDAYRDVQSAKADKEKYINQAQAYKNQIIPRARGQARSIIEKALAYQNSVVAKAIGETKKFSEIYSKYSIYKNITKRRMYLETLDEIYKNTKKL